MVEDQILTRYICCNGSIIQCRKSRWYWISKWKFYKNDSLRFILVKVNWRNCKTNSMKPPSISSWSKIFVMSEHIWGIDKKYAVLHDFEEHELGYVNWQVKSTS